MKSLGAKVTYSALQRDFGEAETDRFPPLLPTSAFSLIEVRFTPRSLTVARKTIENFLERALRLYEQEPGERWGSARLESYVTLCRRWATAGL